MVVDVVLVGGTQDVPGGQSGGDPSRTSPSFADRNRDMLRAGMNRWGERPCMKMALLMGRPWLSMERMTRSPVSGSFRDRTMTSTNGSFTSPRSFSDNRRRMKGNALPGRSRSPTCRSWWAR